MGLELDKCKYVTKPTLGLLGPRYKAATKIHTKIGRQSLLIR